MDTLQQEALSTQKIHHFGLVMDVIDQLGITQYIDQELPLDASKGAIVSMGQRVAAMLTNGLGFVSSPLYMYPEFLEDKAVSKESYRLSAFIAVCQACCVFSLSLSHLSAYWGEAVER